MLSLALDHSGGSPLQILCLGSHADDIEIGCGGTLLKIIESHRNVKVHWIVFSASEQRAIEAQTSATKFLEGAAETQIEVKAFRDGFFPYVGYDIKEFFEGLKRRCSPNLIFTHYRDDRHQDHRLISDLTWNTYRDHLILEYEIPKYDGDLGSPNCFVPLDTPPASARSGGSQSCSKRSRIATGLPKTLSFPCTIERSNWAAGGYAEALPSESYARRHPRIDNHFFAGTGTRWTQSQCSGRISGLASLLPWSRPERHLRADSITVVTSTGRCRMALSGTTVRTCRIRRTSISSNSSSTWSAAG